jgi:hypothetical protein
MKRRHKVKEGKDIKMYETELSFSVTEEWPLMNYQQEPNLFSCEVPML